MLVDSIMLITCLSRICVSREKSRILLLWNGPLHHRNSCKLFIFNMFWALESKDSMYKWWLYSLLYKREELSSGLGIISEYSEHGAGDSLAVDLLNTSHNLIQDMILLRTMILLIPCTCDKPPPPPPHQRAPLPPSLRWRSPWWVSPAPAASCCTSPRSWPACSAPAPCPGAGSRCWPCPWRGPCDAHREWRTRYPSPPPSHQCPRWTLRSKQSHQYLNHLC